MISKLINLKEAIIEAQLNGEKDRALALQIDEDDINKQLEEEEKKHLQKKKKKKSSCYSAVAEDFQRAQDALKHAQNALKKSANASTSKVMSDGEWNAEKKGIADHVNKQESLENSSQVKEMGDEIQQHADIAMRYRSMYMQLLDKLEECGVFVKVDDEQSSNFSHQVTPIFLLKLV